MTSQSLAINRFFKEQPDCMAHSRNADELKERFEALVAVPKNTTKTGTAKDRLAVFASKGLAEGTHWFNMGKVFEHNFARTYPNPTIKYWLEKQVGIPSDQCQLAFMDNGDIFLFKIEPKNIEAVKIKALPTLDGKAVDFSVQERPKKRAAVDPRFGDMPDVSGMAICMPNYHGGDTPSDITRLHNAGFPHRRIVAVEKDKTVYGRLYEQVRGLGVITVNQDVEEVVWDLANDGDRVSCYYADYCGQFTKKVLHGFEGLMGNLTDNARVMATFSRCHDSVKFDDIYGPLMFEKLAKMRKRHFFPSEAYATPAACLWITLVINHALGLTAEQFANRVTMPTPKTGYYVEVKSIDYYADSVPMEFSTFDLRKVDDPADHLPDMIRDLMISFSA